MTGTGRRIAFYSDAEERGGAEASLAYLLQHLRASTEVAILGTSPDVVAWLGRQRPSATTVVLPALVDKRDVASWHRHRRTIARLRPQVFHANLRSLWSCQYALAAALTVPGVRTVAVEHSPVASPSATSRRLKSWTSARLAAHVAVGRSVARTIEELAQRPAGSIRTIHNGVPVRPALIHPPVRRDRFVLATAARLDHLKGLDVLLRALPGLHEVDLLVYGDGPARRALTSLAEELAVADRVSFLGWRDDALDEAARQADAFVLPSRLEAFPLTVLEAMSRGLPVVATDVGSTREAVVQDVTGMLVPPDDVDGLARAIRCLRDPDRRRRLAAAGHELVSTRFSAVTMAAAFEQLYDDVTSAVRTPRPPAGAPRRGRRS